MRELRIPVLLEEKSGFNREGHPVRFGIPLPRDLVHAAEEICVMSSLRGRVSHQARPLAVWSDGSLKWVLVDALVTLAAHESDTLYVTSATAAGGGALPLERKLTVEESATGITIDTDAARFEMTRNAPCLFADVRQGTTRLLNGEASHIRLVDSNGVQYTPAVDRVFVEEQGPIRAAVVTEGGFSAGGRKVPLTFRSRAVFTAGSACVELEFQVRNPQPAHHAGGLWDLGDPGSYVFEDLSIHIVPAAAATGVSWYAENPAWVRQAASAELRLYQDSSGGEHWNSANHVDRTGGRSVAFSGYRIYGESGELLTQGRRATPGLLVASDTGWVAATVRDFWQNFPKALRWQRGALAIGLFPTESQACFELQGGEQKRHTVYLEFGLTQQRTVLPERQYPPEISVDPAWIESSRAIACFLPESRDRNAAYLQYIHNIVAGPHSFVNKRERIDEYGWRHFGDLYADHEAVNHRGSEPLVSHYNNQYDFIYGAGVHFLRTGDGRWRQLFEDAARHTIDIDIYHTSGDRAAFNGGLFWHTDHYKPAATGTHRTYSRRNADGRAYGGGPSNEHNYTSGLLLYFYLSGDPEAREAVLGLADWVIAMDDGSRSLLALIDERPTGLASQTVSPSYHKPGRGAGNSVNALLDAYALSRERGYLCKAEELLQRCVHPADDIAALGLSEPEHRWSYLVFLQALGKYLDAKLALGETDYGFHYARESLLHYAQWISRHEVPYKDVLHKVELPTETWPAQDIRKCHVLHVAAQYAPLALRGSFTQRATFFFDRCLADLLSFETALLTRPLVILCVYGHVHGYFQANAGEAPQLAPHGYFFGQPAAFVSQRGGARAALRAKSRILGAELRRLCRDRLQALRSRLGPGRG